MLVVNAQISIPLDEFQWSFARSGGPGGQNVNKVASKAVLRWDFANTTAVPDVIKNRFRKLYPSRLTEAEEVLITSELTRDQSRNKEDCLEKLAEMLAKAAIAPKPRKKSKPSKASKARRLADKKHVSAKKTTRKSVPREE